MSKILGPDGKPTLDINQVFANISNDMTNLSASAAYAHQRLNSCGHNLQLIDMVLDKMCSKLNLKLKDLIKEVHKELEVAQAKEQNKGKKSEPKS